MIIDISWPISESVTEYKDRSSVVVKQLSCVTERGVSETLITMHSHTGTHIDAPAHFVRDGATIDQVSLSQVVGRCRVIDMTGVTTAITAADLTNQSVQKNDIVLFKTKNSAHAPTDLFDAAFIYLAADGAQLLADAGVLAVGIDYLGIERNQPGHETHNVLLANGVTIIEGLRLGHVAAGDYFLCCLPLSLPGLDAAPARAVLLPA